MINDPYLTFPVFDSNEELDICSELNTSEIANSWANGDEDDNLSDLLSASQIGTIGTMVGESDLQLFSEASCTHSVRLSTATRMAISHRKVSFLPVKNIVCSIQT